MKKLFQKTLALSLMLLMSVSMWGATQFCETPSGHLGNADFGDRNACVKLTIVKSSEAGYVDVTVAMNRDLSATSKIDYVYVLYKGLPYTAGTDDNGDALDELTAHVNVGGDESGNLMIQFSNPNWGGRWQIDLTDVDFTATCSAGPADEVAPVMSSASLVSKTMTSVTIAVDATDNVGVAKYHVVETANGIDVQLTPAAGNIVVEGLTQGTAYSFVITALDAAGNESANNKTVDVTTDAPIAPYASGKGFGTFQGRVDLYDWVGDYAGTNACGQVDLYVVTWGDDLLYMAKGVEKNFEDGTDWKCQIRTRKEDLSGGIREFWGKRVVNASTRIAEYGNTYNNHKGLLGYGDQFKMWSYMVMADCGARTMQTLTYTRDYINAPTSDDVAPVLASASAAANGDNMVLTLSEVTSEAVFYLIKDEDHNKMYISLQPTFTLPKDGSGVTYTYSCYAVDFNGNMSEAKEVEVAMPFNPTTNLALNKTVYKSSQANDNDMIAANGNDGKTGTRWSSGSVAAATDAWWAVDLGADYMLSEIKINWEGACAHEFVIAGSSDKPSNFATDAEYETVIYSKLTGTTGAGANTYTPAGHARYIRIKANKLANNGWGMSFWEFEVYATGVFDPNAGVDDQAPVLNTVTMFENLHNQITLSVDATDNVSVATYKVKDDAKGVDKTCVPEDGKIVVDGLTRETSYTFTVTAKDAAGNESNAITIDPIVTPQDPNIPYTAAPIPNLTGKEAMGVYSNTVPVVLAHGFNMNTWTGTPYEIRTISGDEHILYDMRAKTETCWGVDGDGAEGLIAVDGYNNGVDKGLDLTTMEYLHIDIWSNVAQPNAYINLADGKLANTPHDGSGWKSFDIPMSEWNMSAGNYSKSNIRWMKFPGYNASSYIAIDNVYFWKAASDGPKQVAAAVNDPAMGTAVVKQNGVEVSEVENGSSVTFIAAANDHYQFVNWTKNGDIVSTEESFETTIDATTRLVANFDYVRTIYCHTPIYNNANNRFIYLSLGATGNANEYEIKFEGTPTAKLTGINDANFTGRAGSGVIYSGSKGEANNVLSKAKWDISAEGNGTISIKFTAEDYTKIDFNNHYIPMACAAGGEMMINNNFPVGYFVDWTNQCADTEAPVLAAPAATALNETDIRLTMSATDNWEGMITYTISRDGAEDIVLTDKASGATVTYDVTGLASDATYTFSIVAKDAANNACVAQTCSATLSAAGDVTAPTNVTVSAKPLTDTSVELTLFANDDYDGDITYTITYEGGSANTSATRGTETKYVVTGLTASTAYTFSVVAADAKPNAAAAVETSATTYAPNLALNKPVEVAAYQNGKEGPKAVDGNDGTEWGTWGQNYATSNVLTVNLQGVYDVATIDIYTSGMEGQRHMTVLGSLDGENFETIVADKNYVENVHTVSTDVNAQVRYIRVVGPTTGMVAIRELAVYGTPAVDAVAPVVTAPIVANGVSATSVQVQAQATDNFCGSLTYHFFLDGVEKQSVVKAYGEEAIAVIGELVMGNTYTFGVKAEDEAGNLSEMVTATAGPVADTEAPVITSVVTGEVTYESVELLITATDNTAGELTFVVSLNSEVVATEVGMHNVQKSIVISGLNYLTTYNFSVVAKDASDNTSLANTDAVVTTMAPYYPLEAAPVPTHAATDVMSVYSNHYETIIINKNFNKKTWCNIDVEEKTIAEDNFLFYSVNSSNTRETAWGNSADNYEALLAESAYTDGENKGMDLTRVEYLHVDIWSLTAADNISIRLRDAELAKVNHDGTGWNSFDLPLSTHSAQDQLNNVRWMKFMHVGSATQDVRYFAIDNVYFYRTTPAATSVRTLASTETMGTICIPQGAIPVSGATFYELAYKEEQNGELYKIHFDQVDRLEPGHAYVFEPEVGATEITVVYTMENPAAAPVPVNGLIGTFDGINTDLAVKGENELTGMYIVYENKIRRCGNGCGLRANCAYIDPAEVRSDVVAPAPGRRRITLGTQDSQIATDIENLNGETMHGEPMKVLINGQVFILRGAKMYNAQGQLVK